MIRREENMTFFFLFALSSTRHWNALLYPENVSQRSLNSIHIYTYMIGHYNSLASIMAQLLTPLMLCEIHAYMNGRDLQFKVDFEWQFFKKTFHGNFIYFQSFCQISAERKSSKKYFRDILFWWRRPGIWFVASRLISQQVTY